MNHIHILIILYVLLIFNGCFRAEISTTQTKPKKINKLQTYRTYQADSFAISSMIFTPDGKKLITGSWNNVIRLWDVESGKILNSINPHDRYIGFNDISPDGKIAVSSSGENQSIELWSTDTGEIIRNLGPETSQNSYLCFSPDSRLIALYGGDENPRISLWDINTGRKIITFEEKIYRAYERSRKVWQNKRNTFTRDSKYLITLGLKDLSKSVEDDILIWEADTGRLINTISTVERYVLSPKGNYLSVEEGDINSPKTINIWSIKNGKKLAQLWGPSNDYCDDFSFIMNGEMLAISDSYSYSRYGNFACKSDCFLLYDMNSFKLTNGIEGENNPVFSGDGYRYKVLDYNARESGFNIEIRRFPDGQTVNLIQGNFLSSPVVLDEKGEFIFCVTNDSGDYYGQIYSIENGELLYTHERRSHVESASFYEKSKIVCIETEKGMELVFFNKNKSKVVTKRILESCFCGIKSLDISKDGSIFISHGNDKTIRIIDTHTFELLQTIGADDQFIRKAKITPDSGIVVYHTYQDRQLNAIRYGNYFKIRSVVEGRELLTIDSGPVRVQDFEITGDGKSIISLHGIEYYADSSPHPSKIKMWSIENGSEIEMKNPDLCDLVDLVISPDGLKILAYGGPYNFYLWVTGKEKANSFKIEKIWRPGINFDHESKIIVLSDGGRIEFLTLRGKSIDKVISSDLFTKSREIRSSCVSPTEHLIATGSSKGEISLLQF